MTNSLGISCSAEDLVSDDNFTVRVLVYHTQESGFNLKHYIKPGVTLLRRFEQTSIYSK